MTPETLDKLKRQQAMQAKLKVLVLEESTLRREIAEEAFAVVKGLKEGVNVASLPKQGWQLKATLRMNRTVDQAALLAYVEGGNALDPALFRKRFELVEARWKTLAAHEQSALAAIVSERPGLPTLEIVGPK